MKKRIGHITILVKDYDEALDFYQNKLGFSKIMDFPMGPDSRWITVAPNKENETHITFVKADTDKKNERVGNQVANHVMLVLETDDVERDFKDMKSKGVNFFGAPQKVQWGKEVVFEDLYGNRYDLLQMADGF